MGGMWVTRQTDAPDENPFVDCEGCLISAEDFLHDPRYPTLLAYAWSPIRMQQVANRHAGVEDILVVTQRGYIQARKRDDSTEKAGCHVLETIARAQGLPEPEKWGDLLNHPPSSHRCDSDFEMMERSSFARCAENTIHIAMRPQAYAHRADDKPFSAIASTAFVDEVIAHEVGHHIGLRRYEDTHKQVFRDRLLKRHFEECFAEAFKTCMMLRDGMDPVSEIANIIGRYEWQYGVVSPIWADHFDPSHKARDVRGRQIKDLGLWKTIDDRENRAVYCTVYAQILAGDAVGWRPASRADAIEAALYGASYGSLPTGALIDVVEGRALDNRYTDQIREVLPHDATEQAVEFWRRVVERPVMSAEGLSVDGSPIDVMSATVRHTGAGLMDVRVWQKAADAMDAYWRGQLNLTKNGEAEA